MPDIPNSLQWSNQGRVKRNNPCPICGKADWCTFDDSGYFLICMRQSEPRAGWVFVKTIKSDITSGYLFKSEMLENLTNPKNADKALPLTAKANNGNSFAQNTLTQNYSSPPANQYLRRTQETQRATAEILHQVYCDLLAELSVAGWHYREMTDPRGKRQMTETEVRAFGAKSLLIGQVRMLCQTLLDKYGKETLLAVPGFKFDKWDGEEIVSLACNSNSLLIPSFDGKYLTGLRVKPDTNTVTKKSKGATPNGSVTATNREEKASNFAPVVKSHSTSYYWLSSSGDVRGHLTATNEQNQTERIELTGPKALVRASLWRPIEESGNSQDSNKPTKIGITEGEFKAFIAAQKLGYSFISVPGITNWRAAATLEVLQMLADPLNTEFIIFYDSENKDITHLTRDGLAQALEEELHAPNVQIADWTTKHKGIDDLLLADKKFTTYPFLKTEEVKPDNYSRGNLADSKVGKNSQGKQETEKRKEAKIVKTMARDVNKVILTGYLGHDAEYKETPGQPATLSFSLAVKHSVRNEQSESGWRTETDWWDVIAWRTLAENHQYLQKGDKLYVEGRLMKNKYTDREGQLRTKVEIQASDLILLESKSLRQEFTSLDAV